MSKTLEEQMQEAIECVYAEIDSSDTFMGMDSKTQQEAKQIAVKVAQIYALEQQLQLLNEVESPDFNIPEESNFWVFIHDTKYSLKQQLKSLKR